MAKLTKVLELPLLAYKDGSYATLQQTISYYTNTGPNLILLFPMLLFIPKTLYLNHYTELDTTIYNTEFAINNSKL